MGSPDTHIHVGPEMIEPQTGYRSVGRPDAGAVVQFVGTVRDHNDGQSVEALAYEAYREMAEAEIARIVESARGRWALLNVHVRHRTGPLAIGDAAVCVTVSSAHRDTAFAACRFIIDALKESAPIWKHETLATGEKRWVSERVEDAPIPGVE